MACKLTRESNSLIAELGSKSRSMERSHLPLLDAPVQDPPRRMTRALGKRSSTCMSSTPLSGGRPPEISTQTMRRCCLCVRSSRPLNQFRNAWACSFSRCLENFESSTHNFAAGRATAPQRGHTGNWPMAWCVVASSTKSNSAGASQVSSQQGVEHCSRQALPSTSTMRFASQPARPHKPSKSEVSAKAPSGAMSAQCRVTSTSSTVRLEFPQAIPLCKAR
mmetsp:Transcript_790/g.1746  ORF Transcript_790/g.1746 Transcript_790/m.1746 type:complete len:221 (-) Transcript_790:706-1368(-)